MIRALTLGLAVAYPLVAHIASLEHSATLALVGGFLLAALALLPALARGNPVAWIALPLVAAALLGLRSLDLQNLPLFAPPVLLNAFGAWLFGHTLVGAGTPLVERLVEALHGDGKPLDPRIRRYARRLTAAWAVLFAALASLNLALAVLAVPDGLLHSAGVTPSVAVPLDIWSLFANVLNYVIVAAFFVAEYAWRRRIFPEQPYRGLVDFSMRVARLGPAFWRGRA